MRRSRYRLAEKHFIVDLTGAQETDLRCRAVLERATGCPAARTSGTGNQWRVVFPGGALDADCEARIAQALSALEID